MKDSLYKELATILSKAQEVAPEAAEQTIRYGLVTNWICVIIGVVSTTIAFYARTKYVKEDWDNGDVVAVVLWTAGGISLLVGTITLLRIELAPLAYLLEKL